MTTRFRAWVWWIAALIGAITTGAVLASAFYRFSLCFTRSEWVELSKGWIIFTSWDTSVPTTIFAPGKGTISVGSMTHEPNFVRRQDAPGFSFGPLQQLMTSPTMSRYTVPAWPVVVVMAGFCVVKRRWRSGYGPGQCGRCGYDVGGVPAVDGAVKCPECGAPNVPKSSLTSGPGESL